MTAESSSIWIGSLGMQLEITDEAKVLLDKRGGTMTIDFIKPTG